MFFEIRSRDRIIGNTNHFEALALEQPIALQVVSQLLWIPVHRTIDLEDQPKFVTVEINDKSAKRMLATELETQHTVAS